MAGSTNNGGQGAGGMKTGAGGKPQSYDANGRYSGPSGGTVDLRTGEVRVFGAESGARSGGKLAGADSEEGRKEPKSLLTATREQLERIASGTGQAVTLGTAGAGQALSRTWDELANNEELHKGVEFGFKAAGEVSKDVGKQVGEHALFTHIKSKYFSSTPDLQMKSGIGPIPNLIWAGVRSYQSFPQRGKDIGDKINKVYDDVYNKSKK